MNLYLFLSLLVRFLETNGRELNLLVEIEPSKDERSSSYRLIGASKGSKGYSVMKKTRVELPPTSLGSSIAKFGKDLMKVLLEEKGDNENVLLSPITVHLLMSMLYIGSPEESKTFKQLAKALHLKSWQKGQLKLKIYREIIDHYDDISSDKSMHSILRLAGKMLLRDGFTGNIMGDFKNLMHSYFAAKSQKFKTPVQGAKLLNDWAKEKTNGLITDILSSSDITTETMMILASACYFKSDWETKFHKEQTKPMNFTLANKKIVQIKKGMNQVDKKFRYASAEGFKVLELPYKNQDFIMYIALPTENSIEDLNRVAAEFDPKQFKAKLKVTRITHLQMPSFDATSEIMLNNPLKALGMKAIFDGADFSKISDAKLSVGLVKTNTVVKVDEEGSEAAAVGVATMVTRSASESKIVNFIINRPFVFMIYDKKHEAPLFKGRVMNPQ